MQKLLAILAACCALNTMVATAAQENPPSGDNAPAAGAGASKEMTNEENVGEKRARVQSYELASRACTSRMYAGTPRGRSAPNWSLYDQCMRERGMA